MARIAGPISQFVENLCRGRLRHRRSTPWLRAQRHVGPRERRACNMSSGRGWTAPNASRCNENNMVFLLLSSLVLINYTASNTPTHPTTSLSTLGPHTDYWPRAPQILKSPLVLCVRCIGHVIGSHEKHFQWFISTFTRSKIIRALKGTATEIIPTKARDEGDISSSLNSADCSVDFSKELWHIGWRAVTVLLNVDGRGDTIFGH
jgi:hypothetical protein